MAQLEIAGDFGILVVLVLVLVTMINSISHGLPALGNDFPDVGFSSIGELLPAEWQATIYKFPVETLRRWAIAMGVIPAAFMMLLMLLCLLGV